MWSVALLLLFILYYSEAGIQITGSVVVKRVKRLTCNSMVDISRYPGQMVAFHQWNQEYDVHINSSITTLQPIQAINTKFTVELEKFDNNTDIYSLFSVYNASNELQHVATNKIHCSGVEKKLISLFNDNYYQYHDYNTLTYDDSKSVEMNCQQYSHLSENIQIGWINTIGDRIYIYNQSEITISMSKVHNGSMLCCIYYTITADGNGKSIQRFVKNKTLMIFKKQIPDDRDSTTTVNYCEKTDTPKIPNNTLVESDYQHKTGKYTSTTTSTTTETSKISGSTNKTSRNASTTYETGRDSGTTYETGRNTGFTSETGRNSSTTNENSRNSDTSNENGRSLDTRMGNSRSLGTRIGNDRQSSTTNETDKNSSTANGTGRNSGTTNRNSRISDITNETDKISRTINEPSRNTGTTNEAGRNSVTTSESDSYEHDSPTSFIIIIISSISAIVLLFGTLCAIKKRCRKNRNGPLRPQLPLPPLPQPPDEPGSNLPFYVNLLLKEECEREIRAQEEPHYEEVIYQ